MPRIASAVGSTVAELFGAHPEAQAARLQELTDLFRRALELGPERIEIRVYVRGEPGVGKSAAVLHAVQGFEPTRADWDTKQLLERWPELTEDERQGWLAFAEAIRTKTGDT